MRNGNSHLNHHFTAIVFSWKDIKTAHELLTTNHKLRVCVCVRAASGVQQLLTFSGTNVKDRLKRDFGEFPTRVYLSLSSSFG